jgi:hypothetical protein
MKTIADFDRELAQLGKQHQHLWGQIQQLQMQRNFELNRLARELGRNAPATTYQPAQWNDNGHRNDNFDVGEMIR